MGREYQYKKVYSHVTILIGVWRRGNISSFFGVSSHEIVARTGWRTKPHAEKDQSVDRTPSDERKSIR